MTLHCPNCERDVECPDGWCLGEEVTCSHCQCQCEVDGDYCDGDGGWNFWLTETDK